MLLTMKISKINGEIWTETITAASTEQAQDKIHGVFHKRGRNTTGDFKVVSKLDTSFFETVSKWNGSLLMLPDHVNLQLLEDN